MSVTTVARRRLRPGRNVFSQPLPRQPGTAMSPDSNAFWLWKPMRHNDLACAVNGSWNAGGTAMKTTAALLFGLTLVSGFVQRQDDTVRPLLSKDLVGGPGREL